MLLLDEPFASLDPTLRSEVREEVRSLLRSVGTAAVMVSHDISDALALGDRLAILRAGRIVQTDAPDAIHRRPVDEHVARIFGPVTALAVTGTEGAPVTVLGPVAPASVLRWATGPVALARPHTVDVSNHRCRDGSGAAGTVRDRQFVGHGFRLVIALDDGVEVIADVASDAPHDIGGRVVVRNRAALPPAAG